MTLVFLLKTIHILSAAVLFGTGMGIAFFMFMADRTRSAMIVARVGRMVILADLVFTLTAVIVQPVSGILLAKAEGFDLRSSWLIWTYGLYGLIGACWLPVLWLQMRMTEIAAAAALAEQSLPNAYRRCFQLWFWLGWPAFAGVVAIYWLMVAKPALRLALGHGPV